MLCEDGPVEGESVAPEDGDLLSGRAGAATKFLRAQESAHCSQVAALSMLCKLMPLLACYTLLAHIVYTEIQGDETEAMD